MAASLNPIERAATINLKSMAEQSLYQKQKQKSKFLDDKLWDENSDNNLMKFNFVNDIGYSKDDSADIKAAVDKQEDKGFSKALELANNENELKDEVQKQGKQSEDDINKQIDGAGKEQMKESLKPHLFGKQVMVQQGSASKSGDISDILALGADDAADFISSNTVNSVINENQEGSSSDASTEESSESSSSSSKKKSTEGYEVHEQLSNEDRRVIAKMTPRQQKALYHTNDWTDMPAHDPSTLEMTDGYPYGFGIQTLFNTPTSYRFGVDDSAKDEAPKVEKQWYDEERYPVTLSNQDVIQQAWQDYYKNSRIPNPGVRDPDHEKKAEGEKKAEEGKEAAAEESAEVQLPPQGESLAQTDKSWATPEVQKDLELADEG